MDKIVKTRKDHTCDMCNEIIPKAKKAMFYSGRSPKYDNNEKQIGIEYFKGYFHLEECNE